jgi:cyclophilin family peptidyl-prolyl cis-trans isomerase
MANKNKIEERNKVLRGKQSERTVRTIAMGVIVVIVLAVGYMALSNRTPEVAEVPEGAPKQCAEYPPMGIDESKNYFATFKMANGGEFVVQLFANETPCTVNNFVFLARDGFYDGVTFHRVMDGFMAQGGDPTGTGAGDPGYSFADEITDRTFDRAGLLAMANSGPNTNGSQFFITYAATEWLNGLHTIFGEVVEGMDVVNALTRREPGSDIPGDVIATITITEQ